MPQYFLPESVYLCFTCDGAIFLDVKHDRYSGLDFTQSSLLRDLLDNTASVDGTALASELCQAGLLTQSSVGSRPLAPTSVPIPKTLLVQPSFERISSASASEFLNFIRACIVAYCALRWRSLEFAITRLRNRATRVVDQPDEVTLSKAKHLLGVFNFLRPFVYKSQDGCLHDSLALAEFLHYYGIRSTCVLGVKTVPFSAHCWVQVGPYLAIEQSPESLAAFSPICST